MLRIARHRSLSEMLGIAPIIIVGLRLRTAHVIFCFADRLRTAPVIIVWLRCDILHPTLVLFG